jgi:hypothetical protein
MNWKYVEERDRSLVCFLPPTDWKYSVDEPNYIRFGSVPNVNKTSLGYSNLHGTCICRDILYVQARFGDVNVKVLCMATQKSNYR